VEPPVLKALAKAVEEFRDALTELLKLYVPFEEGPRGVVPPVVAAGGSGRGR
jgi:hypothetical protein